VLDNCEHVRAGAAALVDAVLAHPGRTRIVATSREALAVAGEQLYPVRSLSLPVTADLDDVRAADAVRVFVDRARLVLPEFDVDAANAAAIVAICRRLDGVALAIELAAARVSMLSVFEIAARLDDRFRLLTGGSAGRQQTLLATMQWSYDLLEPAEQRMLRQLAVFAGGCTLQAATAIARAADEYAALALLTALHDKSLLAVERGGDGGKEPRYRMLETVRQYAQQRLEESGEAEATRTCHAEFFLSLAESAAPHLRGPQQSLWMARLRDEQENLVAAMTWCTQEQGPIDPQCGLRLVAATGQYWIFNEVELGYRLVLDALRRDRLAVDSAARCKTLIHLAALYTLRGHGEAGLPHARAALEMAQRLGAIESQAMALNAIGFCLHQAEDDEASLRHYEQARDLAQANGLAIPLAAALGNIGTIELGLGKLETAEASLRQALHLVRGQGDIRTALIVLYNLARVLVAARKHDDARASVIEAQLLLRGVGEDTLRFELLEVAGCLASSRGEHETAARFWGAALQPFADAGYHRPPEDEALLARLRVLSRQAIGDAAFEQAEAAGRALDLRTALLEVGQWLQRGA
jgi:predicted ATPase/predicted negative regulator of RcsB-dependent stress response